MDYHQISDSNELICEANMRGQDTQISSFHFRKAKSRVMYGLDHPGAVEMWDGENLILNMWGKLWL